MVKMIDGGDSIKLITPREAVQNASSGRIKSLQDDLKNIYEDIKNRSQQGRYKTLYDICFKSNIELIMHQLRNDGFKVKHKRFSHSGYNTIEVSW